MSDTVSLDEIILALVSLRDQLQERGFGAADQIEELNFTHREIRIKKAGKTLRVPLREETTA